MDFIYFLDKIKLPFELPLLMHPITVHFAIAIPIVILILELFNLIVKRPSITRFTTSFLFIIILIYIVAFFAGKSDGGHAFSLLSTEGQEELKTHKLLGMYLVYLSVIVFIVKVISIFVKKEWMIGIYFLILLAFIGLTLKQGKDGGELVYKYGANVKIVSQMDDKIMELEDELDECKSKLEEAQKTSVKEEIKTEAEKEIKSEAIKPQETKHEESKSEEESKNQNLEESQTHNENSLEKKDETQETEPKTEPQTTKHSETHENQEAPVEEQHGSKH
ncbi:DUF2231 domain-containing protein [Nitrosophilus kaiyonis]|uniref:DUF2231 domain-containing protein n=1 Tax=Nitrosophilus kaiyonis TaxID=2930200 RepID=UPI002490E0EB|nr:DUF2231 domain-containing protein [Nitrosophilus kaiyonis]